MADRRMLALSEGNEFVIDYTSEGKAGAVVAVLNKNWKTIEKGVKGDGSIAWIITETEIGRVGFASIHGPREKMERKQLWEWMENKWEKRTWIFGGSGGCMAVAAKREGPHFTRQLLVGSRLDQARLDRIYFTQCEEWSNKVIYAKHDTKGQMSDHRPVILQIKDKELEERRRATYFKTSPEMLKDEDTVKQAKEIWQKAGNQDEDPRRKWDFKWGEVRRFFIQKQKEARQRKDEIETKLEELNCHRIRVANSRSNTKDEQLQTLEKEITALQKDRETEWRRWSKTRWIKQGEAPSKFFFSMLKAKRARDEITFLKAADGRLLDKQEDILRELHRFYSDLYKQEPETEQDIRKRAETLRLVKAKLSAQQNRKLVRRPTLEEIQALVKSLPSDKSPGLDGMTIESVRALGE
ncbi:hypothetical protein R1sor_025481 [Riccia sorocarpa]|uniref:Endonuclease/exonuclease/phosphatase domain-containing protein n=1 Tax=Riccia sorocarpa TaxID=122646 RepID=A0ABD3G985_9MARC